MKLGQTLHKLRKNNPLVWFFFKLLFTTLPALILGYATLRFGANPADVLPGQIGLSAFLLSHPKTTIFIFVSPAIIAGLYTYVDHVVARIEGLDQAPVILCSTLLAALNDLVGAKLRRFEDFAKKMNGKRTACQIFETITQPPAQFKQLAIGLNHVLERTMSDDSLQVILVRMKNNLPCEWVEHIPNQLQLPERFLQQDAAKTLFHDAAKQGKPLWIQDIALHLKKKRKKPLFCPQQDPDQDVGSIICYPVHLQATSSVVYVLSIKSDKPNAITSDFRKEYKIVIDAFITRLRLEQNLAYIKERAEPCQSPEEPPELPNQPQG